MPDRFYESDKENTPECESLHKEWYRISGAKRIGFKRSLLNKTPVRHERESDAQVIWYLVNGAIVMTNVWNLR